MKKTTIKINLFAVLSALCMVLLLMPFTVSAADLTVQNATELEEALRKTDREAMRRIVHRMAPVWELLGANDVLSGYRKLLHDRISSDETVREYTMRIMKQIRLLIDEVNNELRKKNDGDEKDFIDRGGQPDSLRYS